MGAGVQGGDTCLRVSKAAPRSSQLPEPLGGGPDSLGLPSLWLSSPETCRLPPSAPCSGRTLLGLRFFSFLPHPRALQLWAASFRDFLGLCPPCSPPSSLPRAFHRGLVLASPARSESPPRAAPWDQERSQCRCHISHSRDLSFWCFFKITSCSCFLVAVESVSSLRSVAWPFFKTSFRNNFRRREAAKTVQRFPAPSPSFPPSEHRTAIAPTPTRRCRRGGSAADQSEGPAWASPALARMSFVYARIPHCI